MKICKSYIQNDNNVLNGPSYINIVNVLFIVRAIVWFLIEQAIKKSISVII